MYIYKITNTLNDKGYVGQTVRSPEERMKQHFRTDSQCTALRNAIEKYGRDAFEIEILEICVDVQSMNGREAFYIDLHQTKVPNGYNIRMPGEFILSEFARRKLRVSPQHSVISIEGRRRIKDALARTGKLSKYKTNNDYLEKKAIRIDKSNSERTTKKREATYKQALNQLNSLREFSNNPNPNDLRSTNNVAYRYVPYGYKFTSEGLIEDRLEQSVVKQIKKLLVDGYLFTEIANLFNSSKVQTKNGGVWRNNTLLKIIARFPLSVDEIVLIEKSIFGDSEDSTECSWQDDPNFDYYKMDDNKARILIRLRTLSSSGLSSVGIARKLNEEGFATISGKVGAWTHANVYAILKKYPIVDKSYVVKNKELKKKKVRLDTAGNEIPARSWKDTHTPKEFEDKIKAGQKNSKLEERKAEKSAMIQVRIKALPDDFNTKWEKEFLALFKKEA
jgi:group I intron endonuclease